MLRAGLLSLFTVVAKSLAASIRYRATNLGLALVRWPDPRGIQAASEALGGTGGADGCRRLMVWVKR